MDEIGDLKRKKINKNKWLYNLVLSFEIDWPNLNPTYLKAPIC